MPVYCNGMGRGTVPHDSPYFFNRTRRDYLAEHLLPGDRRPGR